MGFGGGFLESFVKLGTAFNNYHDDNNRKRTCSAEVSTYVRARTHVHISPVRMQAHYLRCAKQFGAAVARGDVDRGIVGEQTLT